MTRSPSTWRIAFVLLFMLPAFAGAADASYMQVSTNEEAIDGALARGAHPGNWLPVLDGHVFFDARENVFLLEYEVRPGGSDFESPIDYAADFGPKCVRTGPSYVRLYIKDCLQY